MNKLTIIALVAIAIFSGCNSTKKTATTMQTENTSKKETLAPIVETYWKLIRLEGQEIGMAENQEKEIYFVLKSEGNRVEGFAGCNGFGGSYQLEEGNRIRFNQMMNTLMACPINPNLESEFMKVFEMADNYAIVNNVLSLNIGRRAPLAVFEAVYL